MKYKPLIWTLLLLGIFNSCQQSEDIEPQLPPIRIESIDPNEDDSLNTLLDEFYPNASINGRTASFDFGELDFSEALKATNEPDNAVRYSLVMNDDNLGFKNVVLKDKDGEFNAYITRWVPHPDWLASNNYEFIEAEFTGWLFVLELSGQLVARVKFIEGEGSLTNDSPLATGRTACDDDGDIDWGTYNDFDWGGGEWDWYGSGISSSGGGGSPCNWFTSTATGGLIIDCGGGMVYPHMRTECIGDPGIGGGGGSGGPGGGTTDTDGEPNGPIGILDKNEESISIFYELLESTTLNLLQQHLLKEEFKKVYTISTNAKFLKELMNSGYKLKININPNLSTPGGFNPFSNTISFRSYDDINYNTVLEEYFHAFQHYRIGIGKYSSGDRKGGSNIEFEAKLYHDIVSLENIDVLAEMEIPILYLGGISKNYEDWLIEITDSFSKYPTWSDLSSEYYQFLEEFVQNSPFYNDPIDYELQPTTMLYIFQ